MLNTVEIVRDSLILSKFKNVYFYKKDNEYVITKLKENSTRLVIENTLFEKRIPLTSIDTIHIDYIHATENSPFEKHIYIHLKNI
jgi:hypothetical protein